MIPTVFIVDDDPNIRSSLKHLTTVMTLPAMCFESADSFFSHFNPDWLGCLILDVSMPGMTGIELHNHLVELNSLLSVIIITGKGSIAMSVEAIKKGAIDFLEKPYRIDELKQKIRRAMQHSAQLLAEKDKNEELFAAFGRLDAQESIILNQIVAGELIKDIAKDLDISLRTVQLRRASIMKKLNAKSRPDLIRIALQHEHSSNKDKLD